VCGLTLRLRGGQESLAGAWRPEAQRLNLRLSGAWPPPALTLATDKNPFCPDDPFMPTRVLSSDDPDEALAPFGLAKGGPGAFEAICRRIRQ
jgi:hypothetical protein